MTKRLLFAVIAMLLITTIFIAGCQSYNNPIFKVGDNKAVVTSNGGLVVKQGSYIYFINGYNEYDKNDARANWFGNVTKGAIMRIKENSSEDAEIIVPKAVLSSYTNSGFSIYDNFIYYVSPSTEESKSGEVQADTIQFMRTRQDGQETRVMYESSESIEYKYTPYGLLYYKQGKIYCKAYNSKHFNAKKEGRVLVEEATSIHFPKSYEYNQQKGESIGDYFLYTKASDDMYDNSNKLFIANASGTVNSLLIDKYTYTSDPISNVALAYKIDVVSSLVEDDNLTIYYKKTEYTGTSSEGKVVGIFANQISSSCEFDKAQEVKLSSFDATKIYPLGYKNGAIVYDDSVKIFAANADALIFSGISSVTIVGVSKEYLYYTDESGELFRYKMDGTDNVEKIMSDNINSSWIKPEMIDNELYFFNSSKLDYLYKIDLDTYDRLDEDSLVKSLVGKMLKADEDSLQEEEDN